jgi:hypothetical protein
MIYRTIALKDIIEKFGKDDVNKVLSEFFCPINSDVEMFMHFKAYPYERAGMARTYLIIAQDQDKVYGVCAIYSVTTKSISISQQMNSKSRRIAFGTTYAVGNPINAILIGQLSKNYKDGNDQYITGELLMSLIIDHVRKMDILVPSVSVYVECEDKIELRKYYEKYGFTYFSTNEDGLLQYIIPTKKFISPEYKKQYIKSDDKELTQSQ